jgi:hypothetical protein
MLSLCTGRTHVIGRSGRRALARGLAPVLVATGLGTAVAAPAVHAVPRTPCRLAPAQQDTPGGTSAYDLRLTRRGASCAVAIRVMAAFHRCRTETRVGCPRTLFDGWRCSGRKTAAGAGYLAAAFTCARGRETVAGTYLQNVPACYGAAARDPRHRCVNRARLVVPRLRDPDPEVGWQCTPDPSVDACVSGVPAADATRHVALVGDSHSAHWRAALNPVAALNRWRVYSQFAGGCFYSTVADRFTAGCGEFYRNITGWFHQHPEVSTVFVTSNADTPVSLSAGESMPAVKTAGFRQAFRALPATVEHVVVLRDTPRYEAPTLDCAFRAARSGARRLAPLCPVARSVAVRPDSGVAAARQLRSTRYQVVDLTRFMCGRATCYPFVGGTLVSSDPYGHLNMTFMRTMAPYLLRALRALEAEW